MLYKTVNISIEAWKILKQYALDENTTMTKALQSLLEKDLKKKNHPMLTIKPTVPELKKILSQEEGEKYCRHMIKRKDCKTCI